MERRKNLQKRKSDNFLDKIVKKDFNNELEKVLEEKDFDENVKSILLSILYKIETAYKDYEKVKQDVIPKDEFIQNIINQIQENCETIKLVKPNSEESKIIGNRTFLVNKDKKSIICYPIERKVLYCISKISKNIEIVKEDHFLIHQTLSDLINVGNNINTVEPMRDFNGYSWTTIPREIESIKHNLIYQNLRILVGEQFLDKWIYNKEFIIDYIELLKERLVKNYGKVEGVELLETLKQLSILMSVKYDKKLEQEIFEIRSNLEQQLEYIQDSVKFVQYVNKEKENLTRKIKYIDETLNNKEMLKQEYIKRNEALPLNDKIFSVRILSKMMEEEREKYIEKIECLDKLLNPKEYLKYRRELEKKEKYVVLLNKDNLDEEIDKLIIDFQKQFLKSYELKAKRVETKQEVIKMIYEFRYYCMIPYDQERYIHQIKDIEKIIERIQKLLIQKAGELKAINIFSKQDKINYDMLKNIFNTRIINLEELCIKVTKEKDKFFVQLFDENVFEEKNEFGDINNVKTKDLEIRMNKKVNIFL